MLEESLGSVDRVDPEVLDPGLKPDHFSSLNARLPIESRVGPLRMKSLLAFCLLLFLAKRRHIAVYVTLFCNP